MITLTVYSLIAFTLWDFGWILDAAEFEDDERLVTGFIVLWTVFVDGLLIKNKLDKSCK